MRCGDVKRIPDPMGQGGERQVPGVDEITECGEVSLLETVADEDATEESLLAQDEADTHVDDAVLGGFDDDDTRVEGESSGAEDEPTQTGFFDEN